MSVEFNHTIVLSKDRKKSAHFLAEILGLEVGAPTGVFLPVTTANGVTLDFLTIDADIPMQHYAFLVSEEEFDEALARLVKARIPIQADPHGNHPRRINRNDGGRVEEVDAPAGHGLEILTRPYGTDPASELNGVTEDVPGAV